MKLDARVGLPGGPHAGFEPHLAALLQQVQVCAGLERDRVAQRQIEFGVGVDFSEVLFTGLEVLKLPSEGEREGRSPPRRAEAQCVVVEEERRVQGRVKALDLRRTFRMVFGPDLVRHAGKAAGQLDKQRQAIGEVGVAPAEDEVVPGHIAAVVGGDKFGIDLAVEAFLGAGQFAPVRGVQRGDGEAVAGGEKGVHLPEAIPEPVGHALP